MKKKAILYTIIISTIFILCGCNFSIFSNKSDNATEDNASIKDNDVVPQSKISDNKKNEQIEIVL